jgi:type II secretory pathway pseudopilin PulG
MEQWRKSRIRQHCRVKAGFFSVAGGVSQRMMKITADRGFTLSESVVALAVGMILLLAIYGAVNMAQKSTTGIERKVVAQQDARIALEIMALEIRMASYNMSLNNSVWVDPSTCVPGSPASRGIRGATRNSITIEMDIDDSGGVGDAGNEIIAYQYLSGTSELRITRETLRCPGPTTSSPQPFLGAAESETASRSVRVINDELNLPVFRYYDGAGTELFPTAGDQSSVPNIRRVNITIAVETADIDPASGQRRRLIYGTSVIPKNHGISVNTATP